MKIQNMNHETRKSFTKLMLGLSGVVLSAALLISIADFAFAQSFPNKPIRIIVPLPPGGGVDLTAREIGQKLTESWGQQVVIDNRPGGSGIIGAGMAANALPDGYTILLGVSGLTVQPSLHSKLPYNLEKDLVPVTLIGETPFLLVVHPSVPATSVKDLIALAKSKPGLLNYGTFGIGTIPHLSMVMFAEMAGIDVVHVPYKGSIPAITDLLAGQLSLMMIDPGPSLPHVRAGKMRGLAVTSAKRSSLVPDLPSIAEAGVPGYDCSGWYGVFAPSGTPKEIVSKFNIEIVKILHMADVRSRMFSWGIEVIGSTPEEFAARVKADIAKYAKVIRDSGIHIE